MQPSTSYRRLTDHEGHQPILQPKNVYRA